MKLKYNPSMRCYLCDVPLKEHRVQPGEQPPADAFTLDHVPPEGLFLKPKPSDLIEVPCCFACNNKHSGFDERLRIVASMPFDRSRVGQQILNERVMGSTLAKGRQMQFIGKLVRSMRAVANLPELKHTSIDASEFNDGVVRITKGLLFTLYPRFDYRRSTFRAIYIDQCSSPEQLSPMAVLKEKGQFFERGDGVFQCWRHVEEAHGGGVWMLCFYRCFGYFVSHTNGAELDRMPA
jgi:hypothetical protein